MTADPFTTPHWDSSAVLTIDLQRDFLSEEPRGIAGTTEVLPSVFRVVEGARLAGRAIIHVVRLYESDGSNADLSRRSMLSSGVSLVAPGSVGSQLVPGLVPTEVELDHKLLLAGEPQQIGQDEYALYKPRWGAFFNTSLDALLQSQQVDTVIIVGCNFSNCPRATIVEASERDYRVVAVSDAISGFSNSGAAEEELSKIGVFVSSVEDVEKAIVAGDVKNF